MYTKIEETINEEKEFVVPPLLKEDVLCLPKYFTPTKFNLATQYFHLVRELKKENCGLRRENKKLTDELEQWKQKAKELEANNEQLKSERDRFREQLFKFGQRKPADRPKHKPIPRTKESYARAMPETIDENRTAELNQCPFCDSELSEAVDAYQRIIEDIPDQEQLKAKAVKYTIHRYWCKHCKKIVSAKPNDALPKSRLGINILLYVLHGKYRLRLSHDLIRENLNNQFHLKISDGQITNLLETGSKLFSAKWQEIVETIRNSKTSNNDETSWKIKSDKAWLRAFVADKAVRYTITETRGKGNAEQVLGKDYGGVVGCDFYSAYNQFKKKQRCWAHLLRKARELCQDKPSDKSRITLKNKLSRIYKQILLFRSNGNTTKPERKTKAKQVTNQLLGFCDNFRNQDSDENLQILAKRIRKFAGELVMCVSDFSVCPENNAAERAIRPAVLMRKISGGSKSKKGAKIHEINLSVMETLKRENKKQDIFPAMKNLVLNYLTSGE